MINKTYSTSGFHYPVLTARYQEGHSGTRAALLPVNRQLGKIVLHNDGRTRIIHISDQARLACAYQHLGLKSTGSDCEALSHPSWPREGTGRRIVVKIAGGVRSALQVCAYRAGVS